MHVASYSTHLEAAGTSSNHRYEIRRRLDALDVALLDDKPVTNPSIVDKRGTMGMASGWIDSFAASAENTNKKGTFTFPVNAPERAGEEIRNS